MKLRGIEPRPFSLPGCSAGTEQQPRRTLKAADTFRGHGVRQMRRLDFGRTALSISAVATLLAACGESKPPIGVPGTLPQNRVIAAHAIRNGSWMLPDAKNRGALLYVTGGWVGRVCCPTRAASW